MNGLDLFSGIGGLTLALAPWVRPVAYCDVDGFSTATLLSSMRKSSLPAAPIWDDVRTLQKQNIPWKVDIIYGGFPCQDISFAGIGRGLEGERSGLFFEIVRLTCEIRPRFVFLENVSAITKRGLETVALEFAKIGYDCRWEIIPASRVGAKHRRKRWFLLAHSNSHFNHQKKQKGIGLSKEVQGFKWTKDSAPGNSSRASGTKRCRTMYRHAKAYGENKRKSKSRVGRTVDDVPYRMDRIRALGNAVVPEQAREAFKDLMGLE